MRKHLAIEELGDLVELPLLAVLATHRRDGSVLLSPVWPEWRAVSSERTVAAEEIQQNEAGCHRRHNKRQESDGFDDDFPA